MFKYSFYENTLLSATLLLFYLPSKLVDRNEGIVVYFENFLYLEGFTLLQKYSML